MRSLGQTVSRTLTSNACYYSTYEVMQGVFSGALSGTSPAPGGYYTGAEPVYNGNMILFANETDLGAAVQILEKHCDLTNDANRGFTSSNITLRDLGKKMHLGVQYGSSTVFTYTLVQITQGVPSTDFRKGVFVLTSTEILSDDTYTALTDGSDHYGLVYVSR